jgi:hypothetical protein
VPVSQPSLGPLNHLRADNEIDIGDNLGSDINPDTILGLTLLGAGVSADIARFEENPSLVSVDTGPGHDERVAIGVIFRHRHHQPGESLR